MTYTREKDRRTSFDLVVIGAGSGLDVAVAAAERGLSVALVEKGPMGGTCLNRGCIPSKMIIHSADVAETIRRAGIFGLSTASTKIDFKKITDRANKLVDADARSIGRGLRSTKNLTLLKSQARFVAPYILDVGGKRIRGKRIVIAAGARPSIPPIPGLDNVPYWTSTEALRQTTLPKSLIIIGGGYIAAELGHVYGSLGCKITIMQRAPLLINREDQDVAALFTKLWKKKYTVLTNASAIKVEKDGKNIAVTVKINNRTKKITAEKVLVAAGLQPNADLLQIEKTGIKTNKQGFITVNRFLETNVKNIWALGDIAGVYLFKHSANLEAEGVLQNLFGKRKAVAYEPMPHAIFTHPQIAGVGLTEQEAQEQKKGYVVGTYFYKDTGMGLAVEEKDGFVKLIVGRKTKEILGCHILGPEASVLLHEVVVAMKADKKKALDILRTAVHVHPALSEVVQRAALQVPF